MPAVPLLYADVLTAADGSATALIPVPTGGLILGIAYVKDGTIPYSNNVTMVATVKETTQPIVTFGAAAIDATLVTYPRAQVHSVAAGATGLTLDGTRINAAPVPVAAGHQVQIVIAAGGNAKTGRFYLLVG